jgi:predicted RNA-binding protein
MKYYLTSLRKENYEVIENNRFSLIGFNERSQIADKLEVGDTIIIYICSRVSKIAGYVIVTEKSYWDTNLIWDDVFPKRVEIKFGIILHDKVDIRKMIAILSFVKNKNRFGMSFLAGLRELPEADGITIISEIERRYKDNNGL